MNICIRNYLISKQPFYYGNTFIKSKFEKSPKHLKYSSAMNSAKSFNYHPEIESAINNQINVEQSAGFTYLTFANYFGHVNVSRKGCYKFFMKMYKEELEHADEFIKYQLLRGGTVKLDAINHQQFQGKTIQNFFESALKMELEVTEKLKKIVDIAQKYNDNQCADFITNKFLNEQITSMSELGSLISILRDVGNTETGLYLFDLELEKSIK